MRDILLEKFFEYDRWQKAINDGYLKDINKANLKRLCSPETRQTMYYYIMNDMYEIAPPHTAAIPKDDGTNRIVYINEDADRIFLSITNDLLMEMFPQMIHKNCKSYQKGIGCGKVVQSASNKICCLATKHNEIGFKADLSKYFDTVPIKYIDRVFDNIENAIGKSKIISVLRKYYHTNLCFDLDGNLIEHYQSLKQGCAVASFLANVILYDIDSVLTYFSEDNFYVRYSDDILYIGSDYEEALDTLRHLLDDIGLKLNPKKVEIIRKDRWFKFLGFNIKGDKITLSKSRVKSFQKEIESRTIKLRNCSKEKAINNVNKYLYKGDGQYSWATNILPIVNVQKDINTLNMFVMDAIRACATQKKKIGGLGSCIEREDYTIMRGTGKNVKANRERTEKELDGYKTLICMQKALLTNRNLYETICMMM